MKHAGMNMGQVKKQNRSSILNYICEVGPVSRKDIAGATGLTPAAVTQICTEFISQGMLFETGATEKGAGAGRRKVYLDINYDWTYLFAINIEQERTTVALCNMRGDIKELQTLNTRTGVCETSSEPGKGSVNTQPGDPMVLLEAIITSCQKMMEEHPGWKRKIQGISVAITGIVDQEKGSSVQAYGIWKQEVMVCPILSKALGLPAIIENNVNAFAMAELMYGLGKQYDNLLVIKWGPGVGSTIVIDNKVYEGRRGKAAELGHFIVERNGKLCSCGRHGCLETKVSYQAMNELKPFCQDGFAGAYLQAKSKGESDVYDEAIDLFARTIVNSMTILAPNRVVLCGRLFKDAQIRQLLIERCKSYDERYNENRIIYSTLAAKEDYIGPVAAYVHHEIF